MILLFNNFKILKKKIKFLEIISSRKDFFANIYYLKKKITSSKDNIVLKKKMKNF